MKQKKLRGKKGGEKMLNVTNQTITFQAYSYTCPFCKSKLKPVKSKSQADYMLETHLRKHVRAEEISEIEFKNLLSSTLK